MPRFFLIGVLLCSHAFAFDWKPVTPELLAETKPIVEKDADAEVIFWEVRVRDEVVSGYPHFTLTNYIRIKIFNNRGRNRWSTIDIPVYPRTNVSDISGRTVNKDGTVVELKKDSVYERVLTRVGNVNTKHKSFPMPGVETGSIIEYRWNVSHENAYAHFQRLDFQMEIPIRQVSYWVKPYEAPRFNWRMQVQDFHCKRTPFQKQPDGYFLTSLSNVPAFREEPYQGPTLELRAWSLIYYVETDKQDADRYWSDLGRRMYGVFKPAMKGGREVESTASELTSGAKSSEERLRRLDEYCRTQIKNLRDDSTTAEDREQADKNKTPSDTLSQRMGTPQDIQFLFAALAEAAGFEARIALVSDRGNIFFARSFGNDYFLRDRIVAVNVDGNWRFFNPADTFVSHGLLSWRHEAVEALVTDPKNPFFVKTPIAAPEQSLEDYQADFKLSEDGTLEGIVSMSYTGHAGFARKEQSQRQSDALREEAFKTFLQGRYSTAEISDLEILNASDREKPLTYKARVRIPGYAQRAGKRLFFAPAFFRQTVPTRFPVAERNSFVYFHFPWAEHDSVSLELPDGYEAELPRVPAPIPFGDAGRYEVRAQLLNGKKFVYTRDFRFGDHGRILFPQEAYAALKTMFDALHTSDVQTITLKQVGGKSAGGTD